MEHKTLWQCVLDLLSQGPRKSSEIASGISITPDHACVLLSQMMKQGKVKREGTRRNYVYSLP